MKTPDQIADELLTAHEEATGEIAHVPATLNDDDLRVWMVDAIEADRARDRNQCAAPTLTNPVVWVTLW